MFATLSPKLPPGRPIPTQILNTVQVPPVVHNFEFWFRTLPCSRLELCNFRHLAEIT